MHEITIAGLGPAGLSLLSAESLRVLEHAPRLILRTERHPAAAELRARGVAFTGLDPIYEATEEFSALYPRLAEEVLRQAEEGPVVYAVPGHPLLGEESVRLLLAGARERGTAVRVVPAPGFTDVVAAALASHGRLSDLTEWQVADGAALDRVWWDPARPTLVFQLDDPRVASRVKLALLEEYPDELEVVLVHSAGDSERERVVPLPLYRIDHESAVRLDHLTTLYVPPVPPEERRPAFRELVDVIATLRGPEGCPWDREQTYASLKRFVIEEAYEVLEAVDSDDPDRLRDELGDLLLQVVLYAQIGREEGYFDIRDVIAGIVEKMIRRHPHVFGDVTAESVEDVHRNWEAIKQQEKPERTSVLDGVPRELPALMKALEVSKRVVKVGFEWPGFEEVLAKLDEEVAELKEELADRDPERLRGELGDLLFTVVNVARWLKIDPEEALRQMLDRFGARFREVERLAAAQGRPLTELGIEELDRLWEQAKGTLG
ncbi:MAG: nucleoside triphosphate pyrophosphohydrolase [Armatimonadota bacterium]